MNMMISYQELVRTFPNVIYREILCELYFIIENQYIIEFLGGGKVFYAVIFMHFLRLLNYHVKIRP